MIARINKFRRTIRSIGTNTSTCGTPFCFNVSRLSRRQAQLGDKKKDKKEVKKKT